MTPFYRNLSIAVIVAVFAFFVYVAALPRLAPSRSSPAEAHAWLHRTLHVNSAQDQKLLGIEHRFAARKAAMEGRIRQANADLASAILDDRSYSERVKKAVEDIHRTQGELQQATLEHLFEMQTVLTPEQAEKLNRLAADALSSNP